MPEIESLLREGAERLAKAGIGGPRFEARLLLEQATGLGREQMVMAPDRRVGVIEAQAFRSFVARRAAHEPMAYIRGRTEFFGLDFAVDRDVLIPRADSETLIEVARLSIEDDGAPLRLLDLGVGSGCLLITLLTLFSNARGTGTDISDAALAVARRNAEAHGVADRLELRHTCWAQGVGGRFDIVVANPPYVGSTEIPALAADVARFEPLSALDGGPDGLAAYGAITPDLSRLLAEDGVAVLEIGRGQDVTLVPWFVSQGFEVRPFRDLSRIVRCLELRRAIVSA